MENEKKLDIRIIAYAYVGEGISGGDRIFIECTKRWAIKGHLIKIYSSKEGFELCQRYGISDLSNINFTFWASPRSNKFNIAPLYIFRTIQACTSIIRKKMPREFENCLIYSASDFWPDSVPAWLIKIKNKNTKWIASMYAFAPNPFTDPNRAYIKGVGLLTKTIVYYLSQQPIYWLIKKYADMVFVTNELDRKKFICKRLPSDKVIAIMGGVDIKTSNKVPTPQQKSYDAVFIGRFNPQKGVLELIDIWKYVCERKKGAKLAILGSGELEKQVRDKIKRYHLDNNVILYGFMDGIEKIEIIKTSKIVLHPSVCDSGGMAPCEAMACGLPGISFDLESLKTYYPKGMLKTPCFNLKAFAKNIVQLLDDEKLYTKTQNDAIEFALGWDWDKRAEDILDSIK